MKWAENGIEFLRETGILDEIMKDATLAIRNYISQLEQRINELEEENAVLNSAISTLKDVL